MEPNIDQKIYHGNVKPSDFSRDLLAFFNRGNYKVQQYGDSSNITIQIATRDRPSAGGATSLTVKVQKVEDGVSISVSKQAWLGVAASLGFTVLAAARNPFALLGRIDDLAQDIEHLQLPDEVWKVIYNTAKTFGVGMELSDRLKRLVCGYCNSTNPMGQSNCVSCGAPIGNNQPQTCISCGFIITHNEKICPNCHQTIG